MLGFYLDIAISEGGSAPKVVSMGDVTVEGCGVELGEDVHFVDSAVNAVAHWHVDQPVCSPYRDLHTIKFRLEIKIFFIH